MFRLRAPKAVEVAGPLSRVLVDFGQVARQGQVLAEIDQREWLLQVDPRTL